MALEISPVFQDVTPATKSIPAMSGWYFTGTVAGISEEALPWMLGQGWQLLNTDTDTSYDPPLKTYSMARTRMLHWNVLQDLLIDFTNAYNEGRDANDKRYEDVVREMSDLLDKNQADTQSFRDDDAEGATGYLTLMLQGANVLKTDHDSVVTDFSLADLGDRDTALSALKSQWTEAADNAQAEYDNTVEGLDLETIISDVDSAIDDFTAAVVYFNQISGGLNPIIISDFESHQTLARTFLTDLGTTELARINEAFDNSLSVAQQNLTDRGFYSSTIINDLTTRNTRERNEAIAELNDRLNREKLANEHTLYEQQYKARLGGLEASMKSIDASAKIIASRLQHGQWAAGIRHNISALSIQTRQQLLSFREKYYQTLLESITWESDRRLQIYDRLMQVRLKQFELRGRVHDKDLDLLKYQLDERNQSAAALFGFVERRTDAYPDMGSIAQLTASLGETGAATWQSG